MTRPLRPSLTTGQVAAHLNAAVCARVYDDRAIRCEVDGGRLRAFVAPRDQRRRIRVTEAALLEWAAGVLRETELHALRVSLGLDPLSDLSDSQGRLTSMSGPRRRYQFKISESYTPESIPMWRLAEYMAEVAALLGEKENVHFVKVDDGSVALVQDVEHEHYPRVRERVHRVKHREGPTEALRAFDALERKLAEDNAIGELIEEPEVGAATAGPARVLKFEGKYRFVEQEYGPFTQIGELQGEVIVIGGEGDPVPVHLKDGDTVYNCKIRVDASKALAKYYRDGVVRVTGQGRWLRNRDGAWEMRSFTIASFVPLTSAPAHEVIENLRRIGSDLRLPSTLRKLAELRGEAEQRES